MGLVARATQFFSLTAFGWLMTVAGVVFGVALGAQLSASQITGFYYFYNTNLLGWSLFYTGMLCGFLVFLFSDVRIFFKKELNVMFLFMFMASVWLFVNEASALNLFIMYEFFLLPSFILVYSLSPNSRSVLASIYFLTWTQFGSLLVLMGLVWNFFLSGMLEFGSSYTVCSYGPFWLIFLGFGIKMPMWPFYYWLTKTHVEASSFFSMYLSGFLVKTAVFLFIKFYSIVGMSHLLNVFLVLFIMGVVDSSMKMWHQTDLKKLMAYTTVQEMNFLCMPILWNDLFGETLVALFMATHCLLSCMFFFFIDVISKSFSTRVSSQITGLVHNMPTFTLVMFLSWVLFAGLPFTMKFLLEIGIFNILLNYNGAIALVTLVIMNICGLVGFTKNIFNALFGAPVITDYLIYDLTKREFGLYVFLITNLVMLNLATLLLA